MARSNMISSKDSQVGAHSNVLTIPGKLGCPIKKTKKKILWHNIALANLAIVNEPLGKDCGLTTNNEIKLNFHKDFVARSNSNFFQ
jgi:hypothetical protein